MIRIGKNQTAGDQRKREVRRKLPRNEDTSDSGISVRPGNAKKRRRRRDLFPTRSGHRRPDQPAAENIVKESRWDMVGRRGRVISAKISDIRMPADDAAQHADE